MAFDLAGALGSITPAQFRQLHEEELQRRKYDWERNARPKQLPPPGNWRFWVAMAGRGWGKTRVGAEFVRKLAKSGKHGRIAIAGATAADVRDVMIEGESGILACSPPDFMPLYEPSKRQLTWPNGVIGKLYSGEEPDRLRGPQHHAGWLDELAAWEYPDAFTQFKLGFRLGKDLRCCITSTPKPCAVIRELVKQAKLGESVVIVRGSTYENEANLAPEFFTEVIKQYEGTRLGRQELDGELLEDTPGALWNTVILDRTRVKREDIPEMVRIVVSVDPSVTSTEDSDECGVTVEGKGFDGDLYVLEDASGIMTPNEWAGKSIELFHKWNADVIVAETNNGGDLVGNTILAIDSSVPFRKITASRGKHLRAEPISALWEQGKAHLVGNYEKLEEQACAMASDGYTGKGSPDRLDSMVHGATELMLSGGTVQMFPDFRAKHRAADPTNACHISIPVQLKDWWPRYVSATHGYSSAAHWWCREPSGRLRVYRELVLQDTTPEAFGMAIAERSEAEAGSSRMVPVWLSDKAFERVQGKSVAAMIAGGIAKTLGQHKAFLFVHDDSEREIHDPGQRFQAIESRLNKMPRGFLNVQALRGGKDQTGWDVVRELLRWRGSSPEKREDPDYEFARQLAQTDMDAYREYVGRFSVAPSETLPLLLISSEATALIQAMSGAVRSTSDEGALAQNGSSFVLQSLRIGALASREERIAEPKDEFVGKRLDAIPETASVMARMIAAERAEQQWSNTQDAGPVNFRRV